MNLALALAAQLLLGQSETDPSVDAAEAGTAASEQGEAGAATGAQVDAETVTGDQVETDAQAIHELSARVEELEARFQALEQQGAATEDERAVVREELAGLQEAVDVPGQAADRQRETRELRARSVENALVFMTEAYEIIETGEEDVSESVASAYAALQEGYALAMEAGSPQEAQRFQVAMQTVRLVPDALADRDYQNAKQLLANAIAEGDQAWIMATSSTTLPVTAR